MLVSTKGRYALRVMVDLAEHNNGQYIPLKEIADRQNISEKYLESILSILSKADVLDGLRGKRGGYKLKKTPDQYSVKSILHLTEASLAPVSCLADCKKKCNRSNDCKTLPMWKKLDSLIDVFFSNITIAQLSSSQNLSF